MMESPPPAEISSEVSILKEVAGRWPVNQAALPAVSAWHNSILAQSTEDAANDLQVRRAPRALLAATPKATVMRL